jgi:transposase
MRLYAAFDLHATNSYCAVIDEERRRVFGRRLPNDPQVILDTIDAYRPDIAGVVVESTYNWYWLVDTLRDAGYPVYLANPAATKKYDGLKHADDKTDAFWLAHLLQQGILPTGYIYPRGLRIVRDLLRSRARLVRQRSSLIVSLQNTMAAYRGRRISASEIKRLRTDHVAPFFADDEVLALIGRANKESIDFLTRQILLIEKEVAERVGTIEGYRKLLTISGVGRILSLTIMLETGPIGRFRKVGNYASYCRLVPATRTSNGKNKGGGNKRSGNKYLAWAFAEAAEFARRHEPQAQRYFNRKAAKTNVMTAYAALSHKLARAAYYVMRDGVAFDPLKLFG